MQLAYWRTYHQPCPTYESASTRQFLHGRTETIRTCSEDSVAFTKAFDNDSMTVFLTSLMFTVINYMSSRRIRRSC